MTQLLVTVASDVLNFGTSPQLQKVMKSVHNALTLGFPPVLGQNTELDSDLIMPKNTHHAKVDFPISRKRRKAQKRNRVGQPPALKSLEPSHSGPHSHCSAVDVSSSPSSTLLSDAQSSRCSATICSDVPPPPPQHACSSVPHDGCGVSSSPLSSLLSDSHDSSPSPQPLPPISFADLSTMLSSSFPAFDPRQCYSMQDTSSKRIFRLAVDSNDRLVVAVDLVIHDRSPPTYSLFLLGRAVNDSCLLSADILRALINKYFSPTTKICPGTKQYGRADDCVVAGRMAGQRCTVCTRFDAHMRKQKERSARAMDSQMEPYVATSHFGSIVAQEST